jgi:hypothetical protein
MTTSPAPFPVRKALVPEDLFTDTERALDAFARIARAMARDDLGLLTHK